MTETCTSTKVTKTSNILYITMNRAVQSWITGSLISNPSLGSKNSGDAAGCLSREMI